MKIITKIWAEGANMEKNSKRQRDRELAAKTKTDKIHQGRIITVYQETLYFEDKTSVFDFVKHPGAVAILPVDANGKLLLIKQWRRASGKILIEVPAGTLEKGEYPIECAARELREETGFSAETLIPLGGFYSAPGFCDEYIHLFLAKDLSPNPLWSDDSDDIDLFPVSLEEAMMLSTRGELLDSKTLAALYLYQLWTANLTR